MLNPNERYRVELNQYLFSGMGIQDEACTIRGERHLPQPAPFYEDGEPHLSRTPQLPERIQSSAHRSARVEHIVNEPQPFPLNGEGQMSGTRDPQLRRLMQIIPPEGYIQRSVQNGL